MFGRSKYLLNLLSINIISNAFTIEKLVSTVDTDVLRSRRYNMINTYFSRIRLFSISYNLKTVKLFSALLVNNNLIVFR